MSSDNLKYYGMRKLFQFDGSNIDKIIKIYQKLPKPGIYNKFNFKQFEKYSKFFIDKTKNTENVKLILKRNKLKKGTKEYSLVIEEINKLGKESQIKGEQFEQLCFKNIEDKFSKILNIPKDELTILKNPELKYKKDNDIILIGEVDAIVFHKKKIVAICEMKHSIDDIPDAFFQINRSYSAIKNRDKFKIILNDIVLDTTYKISDNIYQISYIFSKYDKSTNYLNIQSKLKYILFEDLHRHNIKYNKVVKRIKNKQKNFDKINNKIIYRYNYDVLSVINNFKKNNFLDNIFIY